MNSFLMNIPIDDPVCRRVSAPGAVVSRPGRSARACELWLLVAALFAAGSLRAQELFREPLPREQGLESRELHPESLPYTIKSGEFRLLVTPSLEFDWVDNINLSRNDPLQDFILRPLVEFESSYPISHQNLLRFNFGVGYDFYLDHDNYSALRLLSGSEISFDTYVKDFIINVHDRFQYIQDPAEQASVASTAVFGGMDNTAGLSATWDQQDLLLTVGYDHGNFISTSSDYEYLDRNTELPFGQVGLRVNPSVLAGVEGGGSFTAYDQARLHDSQGYHAGGYAEWRPGQYFRIQARLGYSAYYFDQGSSPFPAEDQDSWYGQLTLSHEPSEVFRYSIDAGHELRLGTEADSITAWFVRPGFRWELIKNLDLNTHLSYEHGDQGQTESFSETYDWFGLGIRLSHPITKNLSASLRYRLTLRSSNFASREYTQNLVGIILTYRLE